MLEKATHIDHSHVKFYDYFGAIVMVGTTIAGIVAFIISFLS